MQWILHLPASPRRCFRTAVSNWNGIRSVAGLESDLSVRPGTSDRYDLSGIRSAISIWEVHAMNPSVNQSACQEGKTADAKNIQAMNCRSGNQSDSQMTHPSKHHASNPGYSQPMTLPGYCSMPSCENRSCQKPMPLSADAPGRRTMPCSADASGRRTMPCSADAPGRRPVFRPAMDASCSALMNQVYQTGFAVDDILLYLDTHPCDSAALAYYQQVHTLYQNAVQAYESQYGPLFMTSVDDRNYWTWINEPWPWEGGCI